MGAHLLERIGLERDDPEPAVGQGAGAEASAGPHIHHKRARGERVGNGLHGRRGHALGQRGRHTAQFAGRGRGLHQIIGRTPREPDAAHRRSAHADLARLAPMAIVRGRRQP